MSSNFILILGKTRPRNFEGVFLSAAFNASARKKSAYIATTYTSRPKTRVVFLLVFLEIKNNTM